MTANDDVDDATVGPCGAKVCARSPYDHQARFSDCETSLAIMGPGLNGRTHQVRDGRVVCGA